MDTGYFPAEGRLILNPTSYSTGGTDLGLVQSAHMVNVLSDTEFITEHGSGGSVSDARTTSMNINYSIHLSEYGTSIIELLFNGSNDGDTWHGFTGYNVGDILGSSHTHKLLIRPINDNGTHDINKPTIYIPRAIIQGGNLLVWDRRLAHTSGMALAVAGLFDTTYNSPFLYGDAATLPTIV